mgnify:CR=1 FL=1
MQTTLRSSLAMCNFRSLRPQAQLCLDAEGCIAKVAENPVQEMQHRKVCGFPKQQLPKRG